MDRNGDRTELLHQPCPRCTKAVLPLAKFCPRCGMQLQVPPVAQVATVPPIPDALPPQPLSYLTPVPRPCKEAGEALTYAILGIFCVGIILEPIAIFKALKAKRLMRDDPQLTGAGKANAALWLAVAMLALQSLGFLQRLFR